MNVYTYRSSAMKTKVGITWGSRSQTAFTADIRGDKVA
jgi:hypothetical protein